MWISGKVIHILTSYIKKLFWIGNTHIQSVFVKSYQQIFVINLFLIVVKLWITCSIQDEYLSSTVLVINLKVLKTPVKTLTNARVRL